MYIIIKDVLDSQYGYWVDDKKLYPKDNVM